MGQHKERLPHVPLPGPLCSLEEMGELLLPRGFPGPQVLAPWAWVPFVDSPPCRAQPSVSAQSVPWCPQDGQWVGRQAPDLP